MCGRGGVGVGGGGDNSDWRARRGNGRKRNRGRDITLGRGNQDVHNYTEFEHPFSLTLMEGNVIYARDLETQEPSRSREVQMKKLHTRCGWTCSTDCLWRTV